MHKYYKLFLALTGIIMAMPGCYKKPMEISHGLTAKVNGTDYKATTYKASKNYFYTMVGVNTYNDSNFIIVSSQGDNNLSFSVPLPVKRATYQLYINNTNLQASATYRESVYVAESSQSGILTITNITTDNVQGWFNFTTPKAYSISGEFNMY